MVTRLHYKESGRDTQLRALENCCQFPVSFAQAKDWLLRQQKGQSEALETGAVNEDTREVVADLNCSLAEQPASTAALLEQLGRLASPVIPPPPPVLSLGPEPVTDHVRAEECAEKRSP